MNGDVTVRTKEGMTVRIPYTTIKKIKIPTKSEESTEEITGEKKSTEKPPVQEVPKNKPNKK
jgi:hypothetical protein